MALSTVCSVSCRPSLQPLQFLRPPSIGTSSSPLFHSHLDSKSFILCPLSICTHHHPILAYSGSNDGIETERLKSCLLDDDLLRRIVVKKDAHQAIEMIAEAKTNVSGGTVENDDCRLIIEAALVEKNVELALSVFYAMLSGRAQGMNEVTNLERWGWARPNVQTYTLLVRGLAACLRVADALGIIGLVSGAGIASGDEVPFGMIVQCPICMLAIAVAQPQHGVQLVKSIRFLWLFGVQYVQVLWLSGVHEFMRDEVDVNIAAPSTQSSRHNIDEEEGNRGHMPTVVEGNEIISSDSDDELDDNIE